ncbi:lysine--tRNA ligase [Candidatus Woesearchaeota archaeon]|nr:lysine--tRNA ligase [Candidatus Woesearchaeota archaeon]MBT7169491.1 lysine--tRNA ligase [Candidatus Woesearchaeota archaeon]
MAKDIHWADKAAENLIHRNPKKKLFTLAAGISPSGTIHIGNFRDLITAESVSRALKDKGKKVRFIFSWDDYDRLRKIPKNVSDDFEKHMGMPYSKIPNPFGKTGTYASHFEKELEKDIPSLGVNPEFIYQTKMYSAGKYKDGIIEAMGKRKEIASILAEFRTQGFTEEEIENYYPLEIYCENCGKDFTKIKSYDEDTTEIEYSCKCGHENKVNLKEKNIGKLQWKVDWAMRWRYEDVCYEPGGKDHSAPQGSYQVARRISKDVFDFEPPMYQPYDFIGLRGLSSKISGSTGTNISPGNLLKIYEPELLRWLFLRTLPTKSFDFCFDSEIIRQYDELDRASKDYKNDKIKDSKKRALDLSKIDKDFINTDNIPFRLIANIGQITQGNLNEVKRILKETEDNSNEESIKRRLILSQNWIDEFSPENKIELVESGNKEFYNALSKHEQQELVNFFSNIKDNWDLEKLTKLAYEVPKQEGLDEQQLKKRQREFFKNIYMYLIGKETGPRLATFIISIGKTKIENISKNII